MRPNSEHEGTWRCEADPTGLPRYRNRGSTWNTGAQSFAVSSGALSLADANRSTDLHDDE